MLFISKYISTGLAFRGGLQRLFWVLFAWWDKDGRGIYQDGLELHSPRGGQVLRVVFMHIPRDTLSSTGDSLKRKQLKISAVHHRVCDDDVRVHGGSKSFFCFG
jgi:hypothetical protein